MDFSIMSFDHYVFRIINGLAGTKTLDYLARHEEQATATW